MFWWFERGGTYTRCEVVQLAAGTYELRITDPDGVEGVEAFSDAAVLARRQQDVIENLTARGWSGPHGWVL